MYKIGQVEMKDIITKVIDPVITIFPATVEYTFQRNTHALAHFTTRLTLFQMFYKKTPSNIRDIEQRHAKSFSHTLY